MTESETRIQYRTAFVGMVTAAVLISAAVGSVGIYSDALDGYWPLLGAIIYGGLVLLGKKMLDQSEAIRRE